jgi:pimeloyl-ACP methyl ester carboxylesterase
MQSIDRGEFVDVNGVPQWLTIRGADRRRPALLLLGGPGAGYAALAPFFAEWERDFTVLYWDPPGAGFTFAKSRTEPESLAALAADGVQVAELARERLGVRQLAVLGFSAGTMVGLHMVRRCPEIFSAYVGSGQFVDWARQDSLSYELLLQRAAALGNAPMLAELRAIGAPPYADAATDAVKSKYAGAPTPREAAAFAELMPFVGAALQGAPAGATYLAPGHAWPEPRSRSFAAYTALRREIVTFDARRLGFAFSVPMFFFQGADDAFTVTSEVEAYAAELRAPRVELATIPGAGHSVLLLRRELATLLVERVRPRLRDLPRA